ncbi:unnamed protein product [Linum trigynum]|uniref:RNase H type-1 domain-containing protein n=1 Tax=Linum trigynum TaxID=586398 RepID=A0AAV2EAK2_9ROSI
MNLDETDNEILVIEWATLFSIAAWLIWKNINDLCFKEATYTLSPPSLAHSIIAKARILSEGWRAPSSWPNLRKAPTAMVVVAIAWIPPTGGWVKLNIVGTSNENPSLASAGDVLRDGAGHLLSGFVAKIGQASAALAELWEFYHGLDLAWKSRYRQLVLDSDSQLSIQWINDIHDSVHPYATLLSSIHRIISRYGLVRIVHVYWEENRVVDWFSKHSLVYPYGMHELVHPPLGIISVLH